jgi:hypothetical protein
VVGLQAWDCEILFLDDSVCGGTGCTEVPLMEVRKDAVDPIRL